MIAPLIQPRTYRLGFEGVTFASNGHDVTGSLGIRFQFLPQPGNVHIHGPRPDEGLIVPDAREQALPGQGLAAMVDQMAEQLDLLGGQVHRGTLSEHFAPLEINIDITESVSENGRQGRLSEATQTRHGRGVLLSQTA